MKTEILAILDFWFGEFEDGMVKPEIQKRWWIKDLDFDERIKAQFLDQVKLASIEGLDEWKKTPEGYLALIILLDQFRRNIFRNTPDSFYFDPLARKIASEALIKKYDEALMPIQRVFIYMPFMHSETLQEQDQSVELFTKLHESVNESKREGFYGFLNFARKHREVIRTYGRFPHRNSILGRDSSAEELDYLEKGGGF